MSGGKTEKGLAELGVKDGSVRFAEKMPQSGGLESRCMDGSSGPSMVHPRKGLWGFPLYKTGYSLKQKVVVEKCGEKHESQLTSPEKQTSFLAAWWLWGFPLGRKYVTKGLAHLTSQLS